MQRRQLGSTGPHVSAAGLGCMGMSGMYGAADREESIATVHAALDAGIDLLDTGDFYGMGHNELLIREALANRRREDVTLVVKFGAQRAPDGRFVGFDGRPAAVMSSLAYTLQRLGTDYVDVYQPARVDPKVPIEETIGAIGDMIDAGHVRHVGLSEASADTLRRAHGVRPVSELQIEYSLFSRGVEREILPAARELGVAVTAYGVLSRGLLSGRWTPGREGHGDLRGHMPRFGGDNLARNLELVEALNAIAEDKGISVAQLAIAWVNAQGDDIVPLIGARRRDQLAEALAGLDVALEAEDLRRIEAAVPADAVAGARYAPAQMAMLDSEK